MLSGNVRTLLAIAVIFMIGFYNAASSAPQSLAPEAACKLAKADKISGDAIYSIQGTYLDDGEHGPVLEVPACDQIIWPKFDDDASAKVAQYHFAFAKKCGGALMNDVILGVFTGTFVEKKTQSQWGPLAINLFVISGIESKQLDIASITCPK